MNNSWLTKKLGEICKENIKSSFKVEDANNSGIFPFFTSGEDILTHSENLVDGENLFLSTGGYFHIKYYNGKAGYSSDTWSLRVKDGLTKYVYYQILAKLKFIDSLFFRGSGLRHLQKQEFLNLQIPLPPLPEQQKIVYVLDTIQEAIGVQEKIIEKTKELKGAMMNLLFHYGTAILKVKEFTSLRVGELTSEEFEKLTGKKLKKTEIGEIPESWEVVKFENALNKKTKFKVGELKEEDYQQIGSCPIIDQGEGLIVGYSNRDELLYKGPLPVVIFGDHTRIFKYINFPFIIGGGGVKILIPSEEFNANYFFYFLSVLHIESKGYNRHYGILKQKFIFKPPLPEQREIAAILQTIDQKIEIEQKKKALYEELFKAMLEKLMTGEIRVNNIDFE